VVAIALPRRNRTGQPPDPVPCLLLSQLATDTAYAGRGIGTGLLKHALARAVASARLIGGRALVVHALDNQAASIRCEKSSARFGRVAAGRRNARAWSHVQA
jgi:GNAT superfamily N-acetyltransferase